MKHCYLISLVCASLSSGALDIYSGGWIRSSLPCVWSAWMVRVGGESAVGGRKSPMAWQDGTADVVALIYFLWPADSWLYADWHGLRTFLSGILWRMSESRYLIDNVFYVLCYVHWTLWRCLLKSSPIEFFELFPNTSVLNVNVCCIDLDASAEEDCRCQPPVIVIFLVYIFFFFACVNLKRDSWMKAV